MKRFYEAIIVFGSAIIMVALICLFLKSCMPPLVPINREESGPDDEKESIETPLIDVNEPNQELAAVATELSGNSDVESIAEEETAIQTHDDFATDNELESIAGTVQPQTFNDEIESIMHDDSAEMKQEMIPPIIQSHKKKQYRKQTKPRKRETYHKTQSQNTSLLNAFESGQF